MSKKFCTVNANKSFQVTRSGKNTENVREFMSDFKNTKRQLFIFFEEMEADVIGLKF